MNPPNQSSRSRPVGLHHISVMTREPQPNYAFFVAGLGLRLVKKTVNQDDPGVYHLYYGDRTGRPGTGLTFFPWTHLAPSHPGWNEHGPIGLRVPPGSLDFWRERLIALGLTPTTRDWFGQPEVRFNAPDGTALSFVEGEDGHTLVDPWGTAAVPVEHSFRGFHYAEARLRSPEATDRLFTEVLGFNRERADGNSQRYDTGEGSDQFFVLTADPLGPRARAGSGTVHHVAFRVPDDATHAAVRERLLAAGLQVTPVIDRFYFKAIYFRDPNGLLFEIATDPPGFALDEAEAHLGETLALPPFLENRRAEIERSLPPLEA
ncbi:MAG: ring-cleaving dioxygenase [Verrucomicrobiota bacterium]